MKPLGDEKDVNEAGEVHLYLALFYNVVQFEWNMKDTFSPINIHFRCLKKPTHCSIVHISPLKNY